MASHDGETRPAGRPAQPLRRRLLGVAIAAVLPVAVLAGVGAAFLVQQQRDQFARSVLEYARAFSNAVEAELGRSSAVLSVLAASATIDRGDSAAFRDVAVRALQGLPDWRAVILADAASGAAIAHTAYVADPSGRSGQAPADLDSFRRAVEQRREVVGDMRRGPNGQWGMPVRLPIEREGRVRYVLTGVLKPEAIHKVVQRQRVPQDWVVAVFDAREQRIARSRSLDAPLGVPPSPTLKALLAAGHAEGMGTSNTVEGDAVHTAYVRLRNSGWIIAVGVPTRAADQALNRALAIYGAGVLLSLGLAATLAVLLARRITRPIGELRRAARSLGAGELPDLAPSDIAEVREVGDTLVEAARDRALREAEREALLAAERSARTQAEVARRRLELLADSGALLSRSLERRATLEAVAQTLVPAVVDWCNIDLADEEGRLQRALFYHADPARRERVAALAQGVRPSPETEGSMAWAAATGRSLLLRWDATGADKIPDPALRRIAQAMGTRVHFVVPLTARGRTLGAMAVAQAESGRDLSGDDRALLAELARRASLALDNARLFAQAEDARAQAVAANRAKDEFLAMLGHELRNPLAPIVTSLQLMKMRHPELALRERGIIERQVGHLSRLVDDLLDVSRIVQGKVQLSLRRLDLREVLAKAVELTEPAYQDRRPLAVDWPAAPVPVEGDELRLVQVVCNLLVNAAKFSPPDAAVALRLRTEGSQARIEVEDEGVGIAPELLPHVFKLFVQGEQAPDRRGGGLGLGLGIARSLAALHGGEVAAASEGAGHGSRFTVTLPLAAAADAASAAPAPAQPTLRTERVLVVDDNIDAAESIAEVLRLRGCEVRLCADGPQALAVAQAFRPQAALLDIGLPGMSGYELARALRERAAGGALVLIAVTGYGGEGDRAQAFAAGFDAHFVKPAMVDELLDTMERLLREKAS